MKFLLLILLTLTIGHGLRQVIPRTSRRPYQEVICDIERLQASGKGTEAAFTKLASEIAGGVRDF